MPSGKEYQMLFKLNAQANSGFKGTFSQAQAEFARLGNEIQSLNKIQSDISAYQKQSAAIDNTRAKLENLEKQHALLSQQIDEETGSTTRLEREKLKLEERIRGTTVNLENQQNRLSATSQRLEEAGVNTNNLTGESAQLATQIEELSKAQEQAAETAQSYQNRAVDAFNAAGDALAAAGIVAGIKEIGAAYVGTVQAAGEFGSTMSNVEALSGANRQEMALLNAQAKELGATTKFTANESGEAMGYMGMAGWNAQQMLAGMPGVLNLAAASGEDLAGVSDIVTDSLTGFGLTAADTGHFVDVLATASTKSNTNVSMLGESFKYAAPLCGTLGYSAEDTAVLLGLMANSGIKASQAGTTLRTSITNLVSPTKEQAAEMKRLGISMTDANGEMLPLLGLTDILRDKFSGMSEAEQSVAASTLFGKEAMSGMLAIINASEADYQSLTESIYNSAGAAERMANIKLDNLAGDITLLQSAADGLSLTLGEEFMPQARGLVQMGTGVIVWVNQLIEEHPVLAKTIMATTGMVGSLTAGIAALTAAKKALAVIDLASMFAGPVGPALALVGGLTAIAVGTRSYTEAVRAGLPKVEELTEAAHGLNDAVKGAAESFEGSQTDIQATADIAGHYITRLEGLESVTDRTKEQQAEYHATLAMLAETVPELAGSIDLETDSIEGGTAALREQTAAWEENAKAQAYQESLKEIYSAQAAAELEHQKNTILLTNAQADLRGMEEQRAALMQEQTDMAARYGFSYSEALSGMAAQAGRSGEEIQAFTDKYGELETQIASLDVQMADGQKYVTQYGKAVAESEDALADAESETKSYTEALEALSPAVDNAAGSSARAIDTNAGLWASMEDVAEQAKALAEAYEQAYDAALSSIQGQYDLWDQAAEVSATSAADINAALESQVGYWQDYNSNLASLRERAGDVQGLSDVIASFADGSSESVNAVAGMASATDEDLAAMVESWQELQAEQDAAADNLAEFKTNFTQQMDELSRELQADVEGMDYSRESSQAARSMMDSYISEIENSLPQVQIALGRISGAVSAGLGRASVSNAPPGLRLNGYATGTTDAEPGFAMVGENGPELVFFQGGEQVVNATQTAAMQRQSAISAMPLSSAAAPVTVQITFQIEGNATPETVQQLQNFGEERIRQVIEDVFYEKARAAAR